MNEQLQLALSGLLQQAISAVEKGATFLSGQIPDVIQQLLLWKFVSSGLVCLFGIAILILCIVVEVKGFKYTLKVCKESAYDKEANWVVWMVAHLVYVGILPLLAAAINLVWLKIWIAPKVYLIEYGLTLFK